MFYDEYSSVALVEKLFNNGLIGGLLVNFSLIVNGKNNN